MAAQNNIQSFLEEALYYAVINRDSSKVRELVNLCDGTFRVNNGNTISVDFKTVNVNEIDDAAILTTIPVSCSPYTSVFIRVLGETLNWNPESYENILKASLSSEPNYDGFGIQLWQGDTRDTQLLIGSGKGGQYGSPLIDGMSENGNGSFSFTFLSTIYNRDSKPLEAGSFYAHATLDVFYF